MTLPTTPLGAELPYDGDANEDGPSCPQCGCELEWADCTECGGEGEFDAYDDDPMWYDPGDTEPCPMCDGDGGWYVCPNTRCPVVWHAAELTGTQEVQP